MSDHHDDVLSSLSAGRTPEGLPTTSRGGPDVSVRPTIPSDADDLGAIHAATMRAVLAVGAGLSPDDDALAVVGAGELALSWAEASTVTARGHHVLTALDGARTVGLAAIAPASPTAEQEPAQADARPEPDTRPGAGSDVAPEDAPDTPAAHAGRTVEILALEIQPGEERVGHGSRLLAACADLARDADATALSTWVVRGDEARIRFLDTAGFAPTGRRRHLPVGGSEAVQDEWWAALGD